MTDWGENLCIYAATSDSSEYLEAEKLHAIMKSHHTTSRCTVPHHTTPRHVTPLVTSRHTTPRHTTPHNTTPRHTTLHLIPPSITSQTALHHIPPNRTPSHPTTSCQIPHICNILHLTLDFFNIHEFFTFTLTIKVWNETKYNIFVSVFWRVSIIGDFRRNHPVRVIQHPKSPRVQSGELIKS